MAQVDLVADGRQDHRVATGSESAVQARDGAGVRGRGAREKGLGVDLDAFDAGLLAKLAGLLARNLGAAPDQREDAAGAPLEARPGRFLGT